MGAVLRYLVATWVQGAVGSGGFPYGTLAVNAAGCLVIGLVAGYAEARQPLSAHAQAFLVVGVLGGFTTFSAFGIDTIRLVRDGAYLAGAANVGPADGRRPGRRSRRSARGAVGLRKAGSRAIGESGENRDRSEHHRQGMKLSSQRVQREPERLQRGRAQQVAVARLSEDHVGAANSLTVTKHRDALASGDLRPVSQHEHLRVQRLDSKPVQDGGRDD